MGQSCLRSGQLLPSTVPLLPSTVPLLPSTVSLLPSTVPLLPSTVLSMITRCSVLHIRNVGTRRIHDDPERIALQRLFFHPVGLRTSVRAGLGVGFKSGRHLRFEQVLDFLHRLPWLRSLLGRGRAAGSRLEPSQVCPV